MLLASINEPVIEAKAFSEREGLDHDYFKDLIRNKWVPLKHIITRKMKDKVVPTGYVYSRS